MAKRILIVDDEVLLCDALTRTLSKEYSAQAVHTTAAAQEALAAGEFDLVLLDLTLGKENGLELLSEIKVQHPQLPILILTAREFEEDLLQQAAEKGASGYITKGLLSEHLFREVKRVLNFPGKRPAFWDRRPPEPDDLGSSGIHETQ